MKRYAIFSFHPSNRNRPLSFNTENRYDNLWTEALHAWANTKHPVNLFRYLNETMNSKQGATYMWVAMTHLTPSAMDVVWDLAGGLRKMNDKIAK